MRVAILLLLLAGCPAQDSPDTAEAKRIYARCTRACATLRTLKCPGYQGAPGQDEKYGTGDDVSCEAACSDFERAALTVPAYSVHPDCISAAKTCAAVTACAR